jgi:hypothetical protein
MLAVGRIDAFRAHRRAYDWHMMGKCLQDLDAVTAARTYRTMATSAAA